MSTQSFEFYPPSSFNLESLEEMENILASKNIFELCRLCLTDKCELQNLCDAQSLNLNSGSLLIDKISYSTSVEISDADGLPTKVCYNCCKKVEMIHNFKTHCISVDNLLRKHVKCLLQPRGSSESSKAPSASNLNSGLSGLERCSEVLYGGGGESDEVSVECVFVENTFNDKLDYDPELLKVEIKEEEDQISDQSISSASGAEDGSASSSHNFSKLKNSVKTKKKTGTTKKDLKFSCPLCGKSFCNKYSLGRHKGSHSKTSLSCHSCEKIFTNQESLVRHERMHQGGSRYKCDLCNKAYVSSTSYAAHIRKHTGERPYKCSDCNETFYLISSFERHSAKHRGVKEYNCEICTAAFWVPDDLRAHVNRMH